jgi:sugar lactone lactonase YvrE
VAPVAVVATPPSATPSTVFGQLGSYATATANKGGIGADTLQNPAMLAVDSHDNLWIMDGGNSRILYYPQGSTTATRVYGQGGNLAHGNSQYNGVTSTSLNGPQGVCVSSDGTQVYIADTSDNRVLYFSGNSTTATGVYGQVDYANNQANVGGVTALTLYGPMACALDASNNLYVADTQNHRVLFYSGSATASSVFGQGGGYTSNTPNLNGVSADSLQHP